MGAENSKFDSVLQQQNRVKQDQLAAARAREEAMERSRKEQEELFLQQVKESQARAAERYTILESEYEEKENKRRREAEELKLATLEERQYMLAVQESLIIERNTALEKLRADSEEEMKEMREKREAETAQFEKEMQRIAEMRDEQAAQHGAEVTQLSKDHAEEVKEMYETLRKSDMEARELSERLLHEKVASQAMTFAILGGVSQRCHEEKESGHLEAKLTEIRKGVARMEEGRIKLIDVMLEEDDKKEKKKEAQIHLKLISEECASISRTIETVKEDLTRSNLDSQIRMAAKDAAISIELKNSKIHAETTNLRRLMMDKSHKAELADLGGLRVLLEEMRSTLDSFPSLMTQSLTDYVMHQIQAVHVGTASALNAAPAAAAAAIAAAPAAAAVPSSPIVTTPPASPSAPVYPSLDGH